MTKPEFIDLIQSTFTQEGYKKIKITPALLTKQAEVTARDPKGRKRSFTVELVRKHGRDTLNIKPSDDLSWIDSLELLDILFDDRSR